MWEFRILLVVLSLAGAMTSIEVGAADAVVVAHVQQSRGVDAQVDYAALAAFGPWDDRNYALTQADIAYLPADEARFHDPIPAFFRIEVRKSGVASVGTSSPYPRSAFNAFRDLYKGYVVDGATYRAASWLNNGWQYHPETRVAIEANQKLLSGEVRITSPVGGAESAVSINPVNSNLVIAGTNGPGSGQKMWYSSNGGSTWTQSAALPGPSTCCDPTVAWKTDGSVAFSAALTSCTASGCGVYAYRSTDNGQTWVTPVQLVGSGSDKEYMHVDNASASPFKDRIYVSWHTSNVQKFSYSADLGLTYAPVQTLDSGRVGIGSDITSDTAGNVYFFYPTTNAPPQVRVLKSTNGGVSFGATVVVSALNDDYDFAIPAMETRRAFIYVSADTDRSGGAFNNSIYAAWTDTTAPESGTTANNHARIVVGRSRDGGATWNTSVAHETADANSVDRFHPWMVVDSAGRVHVVFYDTRQNPARTSVDFYYSRSEDGGVTFTTPTRLTTATSPNVTDSFEWGDYNGLDWRLQQAIAIYTDNRDESGGVAQSVDTYGIGGFTPPTGPDYSISAGAGVASVCAGSPLPQRSIAIGQLSGFTDQVTLSLPGLNGAVFTGGSFTPPVVTPPGSSNLNLSTLPGAVAGSYSVTVRGTSAAPSSLVRDTSFTVNVGAALLSGPTTTSPANNATGVSPQPVLTWAAIAGASGYVVEVATDAAFANIVRTGNVVTNNYAVTPALNTSTPYFWRVRASNACGASPNSSVATFTTGALYCWSGSLAIPDNTPAGVDSQIVIPAGAGTVSGAKVSVAITHTYIGDLVIRLTKGAAGADIINRPASCSGNDIGARFFDTAPGTANTCAATVPTVSGDVKPQQVFSVFDGAAEGTWNLHLVDAAGADTGNLTSWCVDLGSALPPPNIFANGFE